MPQCVYMILYGELDGNDQIFQAELTGQFPAIARAVGSIYVYCHAQETP